MTTAQSSVIDIHCHLFDQVSKVGVDLEAMPVALRAEIMLDAGSAGPRSFDSFVNWARKARSEGWAEVYGLVNVAEMGLDKAPEIVTEADFQPERAAEMALTYPDIARGLKMRAVQPAIGVLGLKLVEKTVEAAGQAELPIMVHFGQQDGSYAEDEMLTAEILDRLRPGDIASHVFTGQSGGAFANRKNFEAAKRARGRGVLFDIGHGRFNFDIAAARMGRERDFAPDFISSDVTSGTASWLSLPYAMSAVAAAGFDTDTVVRAVTANPAKWLRIDRPAGKAIASTPVRSSQTDSSGNTYPVERSFAIVAARPTQDQSEEKHHEA